MAPTLLRLWELSMFLRYPDKYRKKKCPKKACTYMRAEFITWLQSRATAEKVRKEVTGLTYWRHRGNSRLRFFFTKRQGMIETLPIIWWDESTALGRRVGLRPACLRERLAATQLGHFKTQFKFCLPAISHPPLYTPLTAVTVCFYGSNLKVAESWNSPRRTPFLFKLVYFFTLTFSWISTNMYGFSHDLFTVHNYQKL